MNHLQISTTEIVHWMNTIRNLPDNDRTRFLDSMWSGQLESKAWLVNELAEVLILPSNMYIFGGWTGVLANMLLQDRRNLANKIRSIDVDPWCETIADTVNKIHEMNGWRFKAVTADMSAYEYQSDITPHVVINTSTEHVSQEIYDRWYDNIPDTTLVVIQGNDYFSCGEHTRCSSNLEEFEIMNRVRNPIYSGVLPTDMYNRFMCIWRK